MKRLERSKRTKEERRCPTCDKRVTKSMIKFYYSSDCISDIWRWFSGCVRVVLSQRLFEMCWMQQRAWCRDSHDAGWLIDYVTLGFYEEDILITLQLQDQRKLTMCLRKRSCYPSVNSVLLKDTKCLHWMLQSLWQLFEINYVVTPIISTSFINNWTILKYLFFKCMKWRNTQLLC